MRPSLLCLPNETLYQICEEVLQGDDGDPDREGLSCLSRTCRLLQEIAKRALFRRLEVAELHQLFKALHSIISQKGTDLVRSANLCFDTRSERRERGLHSPSCPERHSRMQTQCGTCGDARAFSQYAGYWNGGRVPGWYPTTWPITSWNDSPYVQLLRIANVGYTTTGWSEATGPTQTRERVMGELGILVVLALSVLPNLSKVRVPINKWTLRLSDPSPTGHWAQGLPTLPGGPSFHQAVLEEKHFPPLPRLQELDLDFTEFHPDEAGLHPGNISWIVQRSPNLVALRLIRNRSLNRLETPWECTTVQSLSLLDCFTSARDIRRLVTSCPLLRHFKLTRPETTRLRADLGRGQSMVGPNGRFVAALILKTLAKVAPHLETIFLQANYLEANRLHEWLLNETAAPSATGFTSLKTLSLARQNLFEPHDHRNKDRDVDTLVDMVARCPTPENLHIFRNEVNCPFCGSALYRSLKGLYDEINRTREAGLKVIKLWCFDWYNDWAVDKWDSDGTAYKGPNSIYYAGEEKLFRAAGKAVTDLIPLFEALGITLKYELGSLPQAEANAA